MRIFNRNTHRRSRVLRYAVALAATAGSLGIGLALRPATYETPYLPFYGAVLIAVLFGGLWAGLLSTALSAVAVQFFFLPPHNQVSFSFDNLLRGFYFCLTFGTICWFIDRRRVQAEADIAHREADLRRAQTLAKTGNWRLDIRRNQLLWSDETYRIFGIPVGTPLTYETFIASVHPRDREFVDRKWQEALKKKPYDIEHRIVVGGQTKWVREKAELEFDASGSLLGGFGAVQDITDRKQAAEALRRNENNLRTILDMLPVGVLLTDAAGKIVFGNPALRRICTGSKSVGMPEDFVYKGWWYKNGKRIAADEWALHRALTKGETSINEEIEIECLDGTHKLINNSALPIRDDEGVILGALVINEDITDRKQAEGSLIRAEKLASAGRMAATIAHEINNPLEAITNLIYLAQLDPAATGSMGEWLSLAAQELKRVSLISKTTLGFYRDTAAPAEFDLAELTEEILMLYQRKLSEKHIEVSQRFVAHTRAFGNSGEIRQVLSNLVANSIDATPRGGRILLRIAPPPRWDNQQIRITVADTGTGVRPEDLQRIFEAFYTTKTNIGTGLGLWVSKTLVERQGGSIRVRSRIGKGTVVRILLPATSRAAMSAAVY